MRGQVLYGINNIYTVNVDGGLRQCRIKGKVLKEDERSYNPIAVGDFVELEADPLSDEVGWITSRGERTSSLVRWNRKKRAPQVIAANVDLVVCVTSVKSPPFRPRFVDRILVACDAEKIEPVILVNKMDLKIKKADHQRIAHYEELGYRVIYSSAKKGEGIDELRELLTGRVPVFFGQSGVGKSSVLNALEPDLNLKVGKVSAKYDRGSHTTNYAALVTMENGQPLIDTPGIRDLYIHDLEPEELKFFFPEFTPFQGQCNYPSCLHLDEPGCAVTEALKEGGVSDDRYDSYRRLYEHLVEMKKENYE